MKNPMRFSAAAWQQNLALYEKTVNHPFNQALAQGNLDPAVFKHYVVQDAHYLLAYGRALAVCAAKAFDAEDVIQFTESARIAIVIERSLHDDFMQNFNISKTEFEQAPLSLACHHYCSFLTATAWSESYPVVLASLLPCYWVYAEVGNAIVKNAVPNNPYQAWIDTYSGDDFQLVVQKVIDTIDRIAADCDAGTIAKMHAAYRRAAELEWLFWDSTYQQQGWLGLD